MSDETVVSEIGSGTEDAPQPAPEPESAPEPTPVPKAVVKPAPEQADPNQVSDSDKAMRLWEYCCGAIDNGNQIVLRQRGGQHKVLDINKL